MVLPHEVADRRQVPSLPALEEPPVEVSHIKRLLAGGHVEAPAAPAPMGPRPPAALGDPERKPQGNDAAGTPPPLLPPKGRWRVRVDPPRAHASKHSRRFR